MAPQNRDAHNVLNAVQLPTGLLDWREIQAKPRKVQNAEENDWRTKVQISGDYDVCRANLLNMLSKFQCMPDRLLGRIRAAKNRIKLTSADVSAIHLEVY